MYGTTIGVALGWGVTMGTTGMLTACAVVVAPAPASASGCCDNCIKLGVIVGPPILMAAGLGTGGCWGWCWGAGVGTPFKMVCMDAELGYFSPISVRFDRRDRFRPFSSLFSDVNPMTVRCSSSIMDFFRFLDSRALMRFCSRRSFRLLFCRLL